MNDPEKISIWGKGDISFQGYQLSQVSSSPDISDFHFSGIGGDYSKFSLCETAGGRYVGQRCDFSLQEADSPSWSSIICDRRRDAFSFFGYNRNWLAQKLYARETRRISEKPKNFKGPLLNVGPPLLQELEQINDVTLEFDGWLIGKVCRAYSDDRSVELGLYQKVGGAYVCLLSSTAPDADVVEWITCDLQEEVIRFFRRGDLANELYRQIGLDEVADSTGPLVIATGSGSIVIARSPSGE